MNNRERYLATMRFEPVDHPPYMLDGPWPDTMERWIGEGYPRGVPLGDFLGIDPLERKSVPIDTFLVPPMEQRVIREDETGIVKTDAFGATIRVFRNRTSMPQWLDHAVKTPGDLLALAERLKPDLDGRVPETWTETQARWEREEADRLGTASGGSYYGILRNLMGVERVSLMLYDAPQAIRVFLDAYTDVILAVLEEGLARVRVDQLWFGEDFAYKTASLLSPAMFREFMLPRYKRVTDFARARGVELFFFDSDGNINEMLPHLLEGGVNLIYPVECAAGMDPLVLRKRYGRALRMIGGIDKRALAGGPAAIDREVDGKVPALIRDGGYLPRIDHSVSSDISLRNFVHYMNRIKQIFGMGGE